MFFLPFERKKTRACKRCGLHNPIDEDACTHCGSLCKKGLRRLKIRKLKEGHANAELGKWMFLSAIVLTLIMFLVS